jgi:hypothetical protein
VADAGALQERRVVGEVVGVVRVGDGAGRDGGSVGSRVHLVLAAVLLGDDDLPRGAARLLVDGEEGAAGDGGDRGVDRGGEGAVGGDLRGSVGAVGGRGRRGGRAGARGGGGRGGRLRASGQGEAADQRQGERQGGAAGGGRVRVRGHGATLPAGTLTGP